MAAAEHGPEGAAQTLRRRYSCQPSVDAGLRGRARPAKRSLSPVSPFQFASFASFPSGYGSPTPSASASSCSGSEGDTEVSSACSPACPPAPDLGASALALAATVQPRLRACLHKSAELRQVIDRVSYKLDNIIFEMPAVVDPMHFRPRSLPGGLNGRLERALAPALDVLGAFDSLGTFRAALTAGPTSGIEQYLEQVTRAQQLVAFLQNNCPKAVRHLQEVVEFLGRSRAVDNFRMLKFAEPLVALRRIESKEKQHTGLDGGVLDKAMDHLEAHFKKLLADEGMAMPLPATLHDDPPDSSPFQFLLPAIAVHISQELVGKLATEGRLANCLKAYEDIRSCKAAESLRSLRPEYLRHATPMAIDSLGRAAFDERVVQWMQQLKVFVRILLPSERSLFLQIFGVVGSDRLLKCFGRIALRAGLSRFLQFGEAVASSQQEPQKLFKMLDMFQTLDDLRPSFEGLFGGDGCKDIRDQVGELQRKIMQGACDVFWEFGLQVEMQREGNLPSDGGVLKLASYAVNYIKCLLSDSYKAIMNQVLTAAQISRGMPVERSELAVSILHIMESLERTVEARSRMFEDSALSCLFAMNNRWYIYTRSKSSELGALLGDGWLKHQKAKMLQSVLEYQKGAWGAVLNSFDKEAAKASTGSKGGSARELVRRHVRDFQAAFEDAYQKHCRWCIPDKQLRDYVGISVIQAVVSACRSYFRNFGAVIKQAAPLQFKYAPEDMEQMLIVLFQDKLANKSEQPNRGSNSSFNFLD